MRQDIKERVLPSPGPRRLPRGVGRGLRMRIDFRTQTRLYLGLYEIEVNRFLRRVLLPGVKAFDVGAEHGYDSLVIAKHTHAPVAAFELNGDCRASMAENFSLNPTLAPFIRTIASRVGNQPNELALDNFAYGEDGFVPDFIKLDVDTAEVLVLRSAERLLAQRHPAIVVEVHSPELERECGKILVDHGYRPVIISQRQIAPDYRPHPHNRWLAAL